MPLVLLLSRGAWGIAATSFLLAPLPMGCQRTRAEHIVVSDQARLLHSRAVIANLHSDFAMLHRDLTHASHDGVSDFPRMREAGIDLVGASIVPRGIGGELGMRVAFWWWGWPARDRGSPLARALAQVDLIDDFVAVDPDLRVIRNREDLEAVRQQQALGLLLTMEGGDAIGDDATQVRLLYDRGVRAIALTHTRTNALGGSGSPTIPGPTCT